MRKNLLFRDQDILEFCKSTNDINRVHDPAYMSANGKRAIVPGMFAFSAAAALAVPFMKENGNTIRVFFNTLLSSGDFATLMAEPSQGSLTDSCRIYAINHKDTLTTQDEHTRIFHSENPLPLQTLGIVRSLPLEPWQMNTFSRLIGTDEPDVAGYLFAISYASQALFKSISEAVTEIEHEIDDLINGPGGISPFYQSLEITLPRPLPGLLNGGALDYRISFTRERLRKAYLAYLQCEHQDEILFRSRYRLLAISDAVIMRMAKDIKHPQRQA